MLVRVLCQLTAWTRWNVATAVILLNILISLFASAYEDVDRVGDGVGTKSTDGALGGSTRAGVGAGLGTALDCRPLPLDTDTELVCELSTLIRGD